MLNIFPCEVRNLSVCMLANYTLTVALRFIFFACVFIWHLVIFNGKYMIFGKHTKFFFNLVTFIYISIQNCGIKQQPHQQQHIIARGTLALPLDLDYDENRHIVPKNYKKQDIPDGKHSY